MSSTVDLLGSIDRIDNTVVCGWVFNPQDPTKALSLSIFYDGVLQTVLIADQHRPDLLEANFGNGDHSFNWIVSSELSEFRPSLVSVFADEWMVPLAKTALTTIRETEELAKIDLQNRDPRVLLSPSGMFDVGYAERFVENSKKDRYRADPVDFLLSDVDLAVRPHPLFDPKWYRKTHGHLMAQGEHPLVHYLRIGIRAGLMPNLGFIPDWYISCLSEEQAAIARINPLLHYYDVGWKLDASPHPFFSPSWYLQQHGDIKRVGLEPLSHYLTSGHKESRQVHPLIDTDFYRSRHGYSGTGSEQLPILEHVWAKGLKDDTPTHSFLEVKLGDSGRVSPFTVPTVMEHLEAWLLFNAPTNKRLLEIRRAVNNIAKPPLLSIVMPVFDPPINIFRDAVNSALKQSYPHFELILIDDASTKQAVREEITYLASTDSRIKALFHPINTHISQATNDAVAIARGQYIVFLDHDDSLLSEALAILAIYIHRFDYPEMLYSDDCRTDLSGKTITAARFKPSWSPELLLGYSYPSHLRAIRTDVYRRIGGSRIGYEGSQDHDMFLRLTANDARVVHMPFLLYGRRAIPGSTAIAGDQKPYSYNAGHKAIRAAFLERGLDVDVSRPDWALRNGLGIFKPIMPHDGPKVSIIIPTKNNARKLIRLLRSLAMTLYTNFDVLIIDNESDDKETLEYLKACPFRVVQIKSQSDGFNFSRLNNIAARMVDGELLLFLNDDTEVLAPEWLSQMVGWSRLAGVGVVGARLLFAERRLQHGGVSPEQTVGYTMFRGIAANEHGYLSAAVVTRNCSAVTAACLLTARELFLGIGGFDEEQFGIAFNDIDYCLRVLREGKRIVYCAEAELFHHEGSSRPKVDKPSEIAAFKSIYGAYKDPYLNVNLDRRSNRMELAPTVVRLPIAVDPPKVLFCSHNFNLEGAPNSLFEIVAGLHKAGLVRATVVGPQVGPLIRAYQDTGIDVHVDGNLAAVSRSKTRQDYEVACDKCTESLSLGSYDVIFANTAEMHAVMHAAKKAGVPSVWCIREGEPWNDYYAKLPVEIEIKALEAFASPYRVVFVSEASFRNWSALNTSRNFTTIPNGLDVNRFCEKTAKHERGDARKKLGFSDRDVVVLAVGGLIPRKGQHDLILSLAFLERSVQERLQVVLVGARNNLYNDRLIATVDNYPNWLRNRVTIVPESRSIGQYFVASDIFFCGSRMESYPRIILEAELAGLPIITTPIAGIPEQVYESVNALFYKPGDVRHLAALVAELVNDKERRREMGRQSKNVFKSLMSYDVMLKSYLEIIEAAVVSAVP